MINATQDQLKVIDIALGKHIKANHRPTLELLSTVKSVGPATIETLIADVPELGKLTRQEVSALIGVAPFNRDSGLAHYLRRAGYGEQDALYGNPVCHSIQSYNYEILQHVARCGKA